MFKKVLITSVILANMTVPVYGAGMSVDAINKAEFFANVNASGVSNGIEGSFENGNILVDLYYQTVGESNLWTVKVSYSPGVFIPEVVEITMNNGYIHSGGLNSGSALMDSNGREYMTWSFNEQLDVDIANVGIYYNSTTNISETVQDKVPEYKIGGVPDVEEPVIEEEQIPEENIVIEEEQIPESAEPEQEEMTVEEPQEDIINEEEQTDTKKEIETKIDEPKKEVKQQPKETTIEPKTKSVQKTPEIINEQQKPFNKEELENKEPMAEADSIVEQSENEEVVEIEIEKQEEPIEIIESDVVKNYKWYNKYLEFLSNVWEALKNIVYNN